MNTRFIYTQVTRRLQSAHSVASVKQASVLFDEVLFERRFSVVEEVPWNDVASRYGIPEVAVARLREERFGGSPEYGEFLRDVDEDEKTALEKRGVRLVQDANTSEFFDDDPEAPPKGHGAFNAPFDSPSEGLRMDTGRNRRPSEAAADPASPWGWKLAARGEGDRATASGIPIRGVWRQQLARRPSPRAARSGSRAPPMGSDYGVSCPPGQPRGAALAP